jgi:SET domain-containing protein
MQSQVNGWPRDGTSRKQSQESRFSIAGSSIDGKGVFSREFIPAGARVLKCVGLIVRRDEIRGLPAMQIGPHIYLRQNPRKPSVDDFLNHSCQPNIGFIKGTLVLYALREIAQGEELVFDYSTTMNEPGWTIKCKCRAQTCRGKMQSYCDLSEEERRRLRPLALAYLR